MVRRGGVDLIEVRIDVIAVEAQTPSVSRAPGQSPLHPLDLCASGIAGDGHRLPGLQVQAVDLVVGVVTIEKRGVDAQSIIEQRHLRAELICPYAFGTKRRLVLRVESTASKTFRGTGIQV